MAGPSEVGPGVQDSEDLPVVELAKYLEARLLQEAAEYSARLTEAQQHGPGLIRELPGQRSLNIAVTHFQTAFLWLKDSAEAAQRARHEAEHATPLRRR